MSSSARAVFVGQAARQGLLVDEVDHLLLERARATVAGGAAGLLAGRPLEQVHRQALRLKPTPTMAARASLMVSGLVALSMNIAAALPGRKLFAHLAQQVAHVHGHVAEVDLDRAGRQALVADRAVVGHVLELLPVLDADAAARLLFVQEGLDQQRGGEDLVARAVEQVGARHVRGADRLALAAAQAVLDRIGNGADVALLHDQRLMAHQPKLGV